MYENHIYFKHISVGGGVGLIDTGPERGRGLFNVPKMVVSILQKVLELKLEKHK